MKSRQVFAILPELTFELLLVFPAVCFIAVALKVVVRYEST